MDLLLNGYCSERVLLLNFKLNLGCCVCLLVDEIIAIALEELRMSVADVCHRLH